MSFLSELIKLEDSGRPGFGVQYRIGSMVALVLLGLLAGRDSLAGCHRFAKTLGKWQIKRLGIRSGQVPSHPAICTAMSKVDTAKLCALLAKFSLEESHDNYKQLSIDGKTLRGSKVVGVDKATHILHAFANDIGAIVSQVKVDNKTNEAKAILDLLEDVELRGKIITADAMFCQKKIKRKM